MKLRKLMETAVAIFTAINHHNKGYVASFKSTVCILVLRDDVVQYCGNFGCCSNFVNVYTMNHFKYTSWLLYLYLRRWWWIVIKKSYEMHLQRLENVFPVLTDSYEIKSIWLINNHNFIKAELISCPQNWNTHHHY